eukprot:CAMPEP_0119004668 /NCGR_PEP_ID=MMETSP1176-20130426/1279_1 /TAXON_ID=265551 /ORGANISM="Synedropsis recta cf, Strain CCMP1620" /LENGTH=242 /DNA_ID=CAMNT_0006956403 /DNA_START=53 /DNA_END=781 /DNA_ORIENTATION=+
MSLHQRLSTIQDIVFNKHARDDTESWSVAKRQRLVTQVLSMNTVQRTTTETETGVLKKQESAITNTSTTTPMTDKRNDITSDAKDVDTQTAKKEDEDADQKVMSDANDSKKTAPSSADDDEAAAAISSTKDDVEAMKEEGAIPTATMMTTTENDKKTPSDVQVSTGGDGAFVPDGILQEYADYYLKDQFETMEQERIALEKKRVSILHKCSVVWKTYRYGLTRISDLSDLRDSPDAIMPNNF